MSSKGLLCVVVSLVSESLYPPSVQLPAQYNTDQEGAAGENDRPHVDDGHFDDVREGRGILKKWAGLRAVRTRATSMATGGYTDLLTLALACGHEEEQ